MTWIDIVWPMMSAASLTLALVHVVTWYKQRGLADHLALGLICFGVGAIAILEWQMMRAQTPADFALLMRWVLVPFSLIFVGLVAFVRVHFRAGRLWLGSLIVAAQLASLIPNFFTGVNLSFLEVTELHFIRVWNGGPIAAPRGIPNPWMFLGLFTIIALLAYLVDAVVTVWRRNQPGERRRACARGGSLGLFLLFILLSSLAVVRGSVRAPLIVVPAFIGALLVISYDLVASILQSALLSRQLVLAESNLRDSENRMNLAVSAAGVGLWTWDIEQGQSWYSEPGPCSGSPRTSRSIKPGFCTPFTRTIARACRMRLLTLPQAGVNTATNIGSLLPMHARAGLPRGGRSSSTRTTYRCGSAESSPTSPNADRPRRTCACW
jgi:hypothetical protein